MLSQGHRTELLLAVMRFVEEASRCAGVRRIALLGSLTTSKQAPRDADVLVTVEDDMNLAHLARAGRRLKGAAQSLNLGGDIFLANPQSEYIGRTCHWTSCGPGIRASCQADHCGQRAFLNDDLSVLKLDRDLVLRPPIDLWPLVEQRVAVPEDVEELVISRCKELGGLEAG
jgi:hypothetical protein